MRLSKFLTGLYLFINIFLLKVEVQDQIDVTKQLVSLYPFIDKSK